MIWAAREEAARSVADVLARRTVLAVPRRPRQQRGTPRVAGLLATELGRDALWQEQQVADFLVLAERISALGMKDRPTVGHLPAKLALHFQKQSIGSEAIKSRASCNGRIVPPKRPTVRHRSVSGLQ